MLRLENDVFPWLGKRPIADVTAKELLATVNRIVDRGAVESAHRVLQNCGQVLRYAIATGRAERNPAADLRGALPPVKQSHLAAITDPGAIGALLRAMAFIRTHDVAAIAAALPSRPKGEDKAAFLATLADDRQAFDTDGRMSPSAARRQLAVMTALSPRYAKVRIALTYTNAFVDRARQ